MIRISNIVRLSQPARFRSYFHAIDNKQVRFIFCLLFSKIFSSFQVFSCKNPTQGHKTLTEGLVHGSGLVGGGLVAFGAIAWFRGCEKFTDQVIFPVKTYFSNSLLQKRFHLHHDMLFNFQPLQKCKVLYF